MQVDHLTVSTAQSVERRRRRFLRPRPLRHLQCVVPTVCLCLKPMEFLGFCAGKGSGIGSGDQFVISLLLFDGGSRRLTAESRWNGFDRKA